MDDAPANNPDDSSPQTEVHSTATQERPQWATYRAGLRIVSSVLIRNDWRKLKEEPYIVESVITTLRDLIRGLEQLHTEHPDEGATLEPILEQLSKALVTLYTAVDLAVSKDERRAARFYESIRLARQSINKALQLFPADIESDC